MAPIAWTPRNLLLISCSLAPPTKILPHQKTCSCFLLEEGSLSNLLLLLVGRKCSQSKKEATSYRQEEEEESSVHSAPHHPSSPKLLKVLYLKVIANCAAKQQRFLELELHNSSRPKTQKTQKKSIINKSQSRREREEQKDLLMITGS